MTNNKVRELYTKISVMQEYQLLYYDSKLHNELVSMFIDFKKLGLYVPKEIFELVVNRRIINDDATPISYARRELDKLEYWSPKARMLAKKARLYWSKLSDQFITNITTNKQKKEILEASEPNIDMKIKLTKNKVVNI